jgi:hypothetical protein
VGFACFTQQLRGTPWAPWDSKRPGKLRAPKQLREQQLFQKFKLPLPPPQKKSTFKLKLFFRRHTYFSEFPQKTNYAASFSESKDAQQVSQKTKYAASFSENKARRKSCPTNVFAIFGQRLTALH